MNTDKALKIQAALDTHQSQMARMDTYKKMYTEVDSENLGRAFAMYPWVAPEILIPMVLSGQQDALHEVSKVAAKEQMALGFTPRMGTQSYHDKLPKFQIRW